METKLYINNLTGSRCVVAKVDSIEQFHALTDKIFSNNDEISKMITNCNTLKLVMFPFFESVGTKNLKNKASGVFNSIPFVVDEDMFEGTICLYLKHKGS